MTDFASLKNSECLPIAAIPLLDIKVFQREMLDRVSCGASVLSMFVRKDALGLEMFGVLGFPEKGRIEIARTKVMDEYPSLAAEAPIFHWFERETAEQWNLVPKGHPWLKPIRFQPPLQEGSDAFGRTGPTTVGVTDYFRVQGKEIHEVAVGPVHAGIIEPGHFRFQCLGEEVLHLEIELGYQHRGVERALVGGPHPRTPFHMETLAGDTSIGHGTAYAQVMEALTGARPSLRAQQIRSVLLELERLANHTGDLGALSGDIGYLPTLAYCGRLRGDFLNMTGLICGNRFGRNMVRPFGVMRDVTPEIKTELEKRLAAIFRDTKIAVDLLWVTPSVMSRFEDTGTVKKEDALALGWVGPAARACGLSRDVRADYPMPVYTAQKVTPEVMETGDVFARAYLRWKEIEASKDFIFKVLADLSEGDLRTAASPLQKEHLAISLVEGWRGAICHAAVTDQDGRFATYKVVDPSFHNWFALAMSLRNQQISDFPLCNKSFNLSYCGHDL